MSDESYVSFLQITQQNISSYLQDSQIPLFTTNAIDLFDIFLAGLPLEERSFHTCRACRKFLEKYGGLVAIEAGGEIVPVMWWNDQNVPQMYLRAFIALKTAVQKARVTGVFYEDDQTWGTPANIDVSRNISWYHLAVTPPTTYVWKRRDMTPEQGMAEKSQDFQMMLRTLNNFTLSQLETAVLITGEDNDLYRSVKVRDVAQWLYDLKKQVTQAESQRAKENILWHRVATAPAGFAHARSSMIGTLLDDIAQGLSYDQISARFATKMNPSSYQRASAPAAGTIAAANALFEKLGLQEALHRRYACLDEIPSHGFAWKERTQVSSRTPARAVGGVFGGVQTRQDLIGQLARQGQTMTWVKFNSTVLKHVRSIEVMVPLSSERFAAIVTGITGAPPILQWDNEHARNQFSWYYEQGIDSEIKQRVRTAGGKVEDVDIRGSLAWNTYTDLDLWCISPTGQISYLNRMDSYGGNLDVDANAGGPITDKPVENIRWPRGHAPQGMYQFYVNCYCHRSQGGSKAPTPFRFELEVDGRVFTVEGTSGGNNSLNNLKNMVLIAEFYYERGRVVQSIGRGPNLTQGVGRAESTPTSWNVVPGIYAPVNAIITSPNMWGDNPMPQHGQHAFFIIPGCYDKQQGRGRGFFVETLKSELRPVRSVLEEYNKNAEISGIDQADVCGIGISNEATDNLKVRVNGVSEYTIDRWD